MLPINAACTRVQAARVCALALTSFAATAASAQSGYYNDGYSPRRNYSYGASSGSRQSQSYNPSQSYSPSQAYNGYRANWQGVYGGVHLGYGFGTAEVGQPLSVSTDNSGGLGGFHLGYNWQNGAWLLGVEGDLSASWANGTATNTSGVEVSAGTAWLSSMRVRGGYTFGSLLLYGTGGVALSRTTLAVTDGSWAGKADDLLMGWVIGAGIDYKLSSNISTRIEALHYRFSDKEIPAFGGIVPYSADQTVIRAGLTLHLR